MKVILENTDKIVEFNGIQCRIWEGQTDSGIPCHAFIPRIAVMEGHDTSQFDVELEQTKPPSVEVSVYPLRMIL